MHPNFSSALGRWSLTAMCAAMLVACGGGDGDSSTSTNSSTNGGNSSNTSTGGFAATESTVTVASDASKSTTLGAPTVVTYTLHHQDKKIYPVDAQRYANGNDLYLDFGSSFFQVSSSDGGAHYSWSGPLSVVGHTFLDEDVLLTCSRQWGSQYANVAIRSTLTEAAPSTLAAKTFTEYACFSDNGQLAFNGGETLSIAADGSLSSTGGAQLSPAQLQSLFSSDGLTSGNENLKAKAYAARNGKHVLVVKDGEGTSVMIER